MLHDFPSESSDILRHESSVSYVVVDIKWHIALQIHRLVRDSAGSHQRYTDVFTQHISCFPRIALQAMILRRPPVCRKPCALSGCALQSIAFAVQLSSCADRLLLLTSPFLRSRLEYYVFLVKAGSRQLRVLWPSALLHPYQPLPACQSLLLLSLVLRLWPLRFSSNRPGIPLLLALELQYSL